jgi:hypothetical protein
VLAADVGHVEGDLQGLDRERGLLAEHLRRCVDRAGDLRAELVGRQRVLVALRREVPGRRGELLGR